MSLEVVLQLAGWLLTLVGQVQVALKLRMGFVSWIAANLVLIALCCIAGLWWSIGMYCTNLIVCAWSYLRWGDGRAGTGLANDVPLPSHRV
jgi:hypothetical protein